MNESVVQFLQRHNRIRCLFNRFLQRAYFDFQREKKRLHRIVAFMLINRCVWQGLIAMKHLNFH